MTTIEQKVEEVSQKLIETIATLLETGDSAERLYVCVQPDGTVSVDRRTYNEDGPHIAQFWYLSTPTPERRTVPSELFSEVQGSDRDHQYLSKETRAKQIASAKDTAERIVWRWYERIEYWVRAGNYTAEK